MRHYDLFLKNSDDISFEHVIAVLTTVFERVNSLRAEQIALLTHTTGECQVTSGKEQNMKVIQTLLEGYNLKTEVRKKSDRFKK